MKIGAMLDSLIWTLINKALKLWRLIHSFILRHIRPQHRYRLFSHHGQMVYARDGVFGRHREFCICWDCASLHPGKRNNCPMAQGLYEYDVLMGLTTPVFYCNEWKPGSSALIVEAPGANAVVDDYYTEAEAYGPRLYGRRKRPTEPRPNVKPGSQGKVQMPHF